MLKKKCLSLLCSWCLLQSLFSLKVFWFSVNFGFIILEFKFIGAGSEWKGTCQMELPFVINVTDEKDGN